MGKPMDLSIYAEPTNDVVDGGNAFTEHVNEYDGGNAFGATN
jgi:hypothetical protein